MLTLYQLAISHYNEKVRWALDLKGIEHRRVSLIPGLHRLTVRRFGATTTPVLVAGDGTVVRESTPILEYLERIAPEPALFPEDPEQRRELDELVAFLDRVAGTSVRAYAYWLILQQPGALHARWKPGLNRRQRFILAAVMPVMNRVLPRAFGLTEERAPGHLERVWKSCERVERRLEETGDGYLVGGRFTAADLTAASLLGPALGPPGSPWQDGAHGVAPTAQLMAFREELRKRPVAPWLTEIWQKHRRPAAPSA